MISKFGYEGGDSEEALIAALKQDFTSETTDALEKVRTKYMRDGHIIAIAVARGYTKKLGFKGWLALKVGCGETHARNCMNCWKLRHDFDRVADWWRSGNTEFQPSKLSGPVLYLELHKAWKERGLSDAEKLAKRGKKKGLGNKQLRELLALHRNWLDRLASEHMKWAETDARESRVLSQIIRERAEAEGNKDDVAFPLKSTYPPSPEEPDETDDRTGSGRRRNRRQSNIWREAMILLNRNNTWVVTSGSRRRPFRLLQKTCPRRMRHRSRPELLWWRSHRQSAKAGGPKGRNASHHGDRPRPRPHNEYATGSRQSVPHAYRRRHWAANSRWATKSTARLSRSISRKSDCWRTPVSIGRRSAKVSRWPARCWASTRTNGVGTRGVAASSRCAGIGKLAVNGIATSRRGVNSAVPPERPEWIWHGP